VRDRWQALQQALCGRVAGDCVVVVGKGDEPWQNDAEDDLPGDDVTACRQALLQARAAAAAQPRSGPASRAAATPTPC
jgi:UDP-N-acetylmuramyl tripeptide synthase